MSKLRCPQHRSVSKIRRALVGRGVRIADRSVTEQLRRYGELIALRAANNTHLEAFLAEQSQVNLTLHGLQPDVDQKLL